MKASLLPQRKFFAKKSLGQNFLVDPLVCAKMIEACDLKPTDTVLEIGPGRGMLTQHLVKRVGKIIAIEKDKHLAEELQKNYDSYNIQIICADVLEASFEFKEKIKVIGNLPYNIATPIIEKIFKHHQQFEVVYITVQLEYGQRMIALQHTKEYGSFSCFVRHFADVKKLFNIKPTAFRPIPKVQSCFLKMVLLDKPRYKTFDEELLFKIIRGAFQQRRKTIFNSLSRVIPKEKLNIILDRLKISKESRAENLSLEDYVRVANEAV